MTDEFNLQLGLALKEAGITAASERKMDLLALGRSFCTSAALKRSSRRATADDAARGFSRAGMPADILGKASGALFREKQWEHTGEWRKSARISNHGRQNRVYRLIA